MFDTLLWHEKLDDFFVYSGDHWEYIKKVGLFMSNEAGDKKSEPTDDIFKSSKSLRRDIDNLTSYPAPGQLYNIDF